MAVERDAMRYLIAAAVLGLAGSAMAETYTYVSPGGGDTTLDLHLPDTLAPGTPTLLFIHGGGWRSGDKEDMLPLLGPMVDAGYPSVTCNYTLSTATTPSYPQAIHDVKAVVRWIRTVGAKHGLSPTIAVCGPSAGGHLTELLGTTAGVEIFEPLSMPDGGYRIQAGISFFGLCDFAMQVNHPDGGDTEAFTWFLGGPLDGNESTYAQASPLTWIDTGDTPMSLAHGFDDDIHFYQQAEVMHKSLTEIGVPCILDGYDGGHSFWSYTWTDDDGVEYTFFDATAAMLEATVPLLLQLGRNADVNQSLSVNVEDLLQVLSDWGTCPELPVDCPSDIDTDGSIDVDDVLAVIAAL